MNEIDKIAWIEIQDGRILSTRSKGRTKYYIPGGKREAGESVLDTLTREIKEELDVVLDRSTLKFIGIFRAQADSHPEGVVVKMTCYEGDYKGVIKASSEIDEVVWLSYKDRDKCSPVDQLIFDWLKERELIN
jgi:8-oxo-dGTP diphosphatase